MNNLAVNNTSREVVWTINPNRIIEKEKREEKKEPILVKQLIEKTFQNISTKLMDRIACLEDELTLLKRENELLRRNLQQAEGLKKMAG